MRSILKPFAVVLAIAIASMAVPSASAQGPDRVFVPVVTGGCNLNELFRPDEQFARYLVLCQAPVVKKVVTYPGSYPNLKVEWLLDENPLAVTDGLAFAIPESAIQLNAETIELTRLIVKAREEMSDKGVSKQTRLEIQAVNASADAGEISPTQIQLAVGLAFFGPPGWILAGVIIVVTVAVVAYVVLKSTRGTHTGVGILDLPHPEQHSDYTFNLDQLEQRVSEEQETTRWLAQGGDHFLEGTPARQALRRDVLISARELFSTGGKPECQHRDDSKGGTTALWWVRRGGDAALFMHRPADPARDSGMFRSRIGSYPSSSMGGYQSLRDDDPRCQDAREWLLWRILCHLSGLNCDQPPSPFAIDRKLTMP